MAKGFFVASTGQHVGKTTCCLGLMSGLRKRLKKVGFIKPVGQEFVEIDSGIRVDKDVLLFKDHFELDDPYEMMSPVLFPKGFTRDYLDGKIQQSVLNECIQYCFDELIQYHDYMLLEGTGHVGVGSIVELNNAKVAAQLKVPMILVGSGGLGSSFDALALNKVMCDLYHVPIAGVILNRVLEEKKEMIESYMKKALARWNIPLLGCIPFSSFLSNPCMNDYSLLFKTPLMTGSQYRLRHFQHIRLVATSLDVYEKLIKKSQLIITPASREDIILATLSAHLAVKIKNPHDDLESGIILTGSEKPKAALVSQLNEAEIPMFYSSKNTYEVMKMISSHTAKTTKDDLPKIKQTIDLVESHVDFDLLSEAVGLHQEDI